MKFYVSTYNAMLDEFKSQVEYASPVDADAMVIWQDCSGSFAELVKACKTFFPKPVYTLQHGRRATNDYKAPLSKPFQSDKFLAWGKWDYDNMTAMGLPVEIVGCPLNSWIKPKVAHKEKVVLFLPVNTGKEEPDNITVYCELMKVKLDRMQQGVSRNYEQLRKKWTGTTRNSVCGNFTVLTMTLPWHDQKFYTEGTILCFQDSKRNNAMLFDVLRNVDVVVSTDEGTAALFAIAHDVPVVVVDGFKYRWKECAEAISVNKTKGFNHCSLEDLQAVLEYTLEHPDDLKEDRLETAENEMSVLSIKDPVKRIHEAVNSDRK